MTFWKAKYDITLLAKIRLSMHLRSRLDQKKKMQKKFRYFWRFSPFNLEYLFTNEQFVKIFRTKVVQNHKLYPQISRDQTLLLRLYKGSNFLLDIFKTIDFFYHLKNKKYLSQQNLSKIIKIFVSYNVIKDFWD